MITKNSLIIRILFLFLIFFVLLACNTPIGIKSLINPDENTNNESKVPTTVPDISATQSGKATSTTGWIDSRVQFIESDCPGGDLPRPTMYVNMGSLTCNYSIDGGSEGMSIKQVTDIKDLQDQFASSKEFSQEKITYYMNQPNAQLSQLSNAPEDNLYLITYDGNNSTDNTQIPLCVYAGGNQIVNNKFMTGFLLNACSLENNADDYRNAFQSLVDSAMKAIERAEST